MYGFAALSSYNSVLCTLDFYIKIMPDNSPSFVFGIAMNSLSFLSQIGFLFYGYKVRYPIKNNLFIIL